MHRNNNDGRQKWKEGDGLIFPGQVSHSAPLYNAINNTSCVPSLCWEVLHRIMSSLIDHDTCPGLCVPSLIIALYISLYQSAE